MYNFGRGYREEQLCENILNFGQWFKRRCRLKDLSLVAFLFGGAEDIIDNIDVKLDQWFRNRYRLKTFLI